MSNNKELHVKNLLIKADNVVIERKPRDPFGRDEKRDRRDPWGDWFMPPRRSNVRDEENREEKNEKDRRERKGFSWV
ncbi:hypothetical protein GCM10010978_18460 [Compostibacillus humi]|uniref:Uncharacterized protein n=1 Tax=Compostibacillus humi TaxID=1245525 RepID=A0A8J2TN89_9BACI|nr:hypothetical protein [Compostibacillus humi]GFZ77216.1 hypothetical protein GCM10010978_18460 [Compostibacillus humi]HLT55279.1 hypothetical protein [Bacillota bacterium]